MTERAAKRQRTEQMAAETVSIRVVVILASKQPDAKADSDTLVTLRRKSVHTRVQDRVHDFAELEAALNRKNGRGENSTTRAGVPFWRVVAYVGPVTAGSTKLRDQIDALYNRCVALAAVAASKKTKKTIDTEEAEILASAPRDDPAELLMCCAATVAANTRVPFTKYVSSSSS